MADYRSGKTAPSILARKSAVAAVAKSMPAALVIGGDTESGRRLVRYFRSLGWRVAFTDPSLTEGRALAQSSGAQHHPINLSDSDKLLQSVELIKERWGHLDLVVNCSPMEIDGLLDIPVLTYWPR